MHTKVVCFSFWPRPLRVFNRTPQEAVGYHPAASHVLFIALRAARRHCLALKVADKRATQKKAKYSVVFSILL